MGSFAGVSGISKSHPVQPGQVLDEGQHLQIFGARTATGMGAE